MLTLQLWTEDMIFVTLCVRSNDS